MNVPRRASDTGTSRGARVLMLALLPGLMVLAMVFANRVDDEAVATVPSPTARAIQSSQLGMQASTATATPVATSTPIATATTPATRPPAPSATSTPAAPTPTSVPATATPETFAPIVRLLIPAIDVDAEVEVRSLEADGQMQTPSGPTVVSWYDFSSQPTKSGNAVFAGHLDYAGYGPAVFWRLGDLQAGDVIEVRLQDGMTLQYRVTDIRPFAASDDATSIVASTGSPTITVITCDGNFDSAARAYDQRLVVTGDRVD